MECLRVRFRSMLDKCRLVLFPIIEFTFETNEKSKKSIFCRVHFSTEMHFIDLKILFVLCCGCNDHRFHFHHFCMRWALSQTVSIVEIEWNERDGEKMVQIKLNKQRRNVRISRSRSSHFYLHRKKRKFLISLKMRSETKCVRASILPLFAHRVKSSTVSSQHKKSERKLTIRCWRYRVNKIYILCCIKCAADTLLSRAMWQSRQQSPTMFHVIRL